MALRKTAFAWMISVIEALHFFVQEKAGDASEQAAEAAGLFPLHCSCARASSVQNASASVFLEKVLALPHGQKAPFHAPAFPLPFGQRAGAWARSHHLQKRPPHRRKPGLYSAGPSLQNFL